MKACAAELRALGIIVTSSWLEEPYKPTVQVHEVSHDENQKYALKDIDDVVAADLMVFFNEPTKKIIRAGRHVEFGMALALGLRRPYPIFVVGMENENIFHHCPQVYHFAEWSDVVTRLQTLAQVERA